VFMAVALLAALLLIRVNPSQGAGPGAMPGH
jgi:hypothetical protein